MTNNWTDIGNASGVLVWGANPSENHPACMAHINKARSKGGKLVVVDPRKTRTAIQADNYVRIRPGTDIALLNAIMLYIITEMENSSSTVTTASQRTKFFQYLNHSNTFDFFTDGDATLGSSKPASAAAGTPGSSKYTDARFLVNAAGGDYVRAKVLGSTGVVAAVSDPANLTISDFPQKAATVDADVNTVYSRLKAHLAPYTLTTAADVCGVTPDDIKMLAQFFIDNSRCSSVAPATSALTPTSADWQDPTAVGYKCLTMLYAMGLTQHTVGAQNCKTLAVIQTLMGNMGRAGGGINALRGIHNVQGSTDMGLLYGNIPAYSNNPTEQYPALPNAFGRYSDSLFGNPLSGTATRARMDMSYDDAYATGAMGLQQRGFYNMTLKWFGDYTAIDGMTYPGTAAQKAAKRLAVDTAYSLWPKGNGDNHITMFRNMGKADGASGRIKAAVVWGQNPAVTEPSQGFVRAGLKQLDLLVVVDMFQTETAGIERRSDGITYLIPAAAHPEKAGSATNSGRVLQWRYQAADPAGNSRDDLELLLRFAYALDGKSAFSHISSAWGWDTVADPHAVFTKLYKTPYGFDPASATVKYKDVSLTGVDMAKQVDLTTYVLGAGEAAATVAPAPLLPAGTVYTNAATTTVTGSEAVAERVYREMCDKQANGGTIWIYLEGYDATVGTGKGTKTRLAGNYLAWAVSNRAKSRNRMDPYNTLAYAAWGYAWLVNRRVLYNNSEIPGDQADNFVGCDLASRLFVSTNAATLNYARTYRTIHRVSDKPSPVFAGNHASPHYVTDPGGTASNISYAGRFPAHCEPYESIRPELAANSSWGINTKGTGLTDLIPATTPVGTVGTYPLTLTTIRCVEHFQGGPITRNNSYNVMLEPVPWVEINSADARVAGISDGDMVKIVTARTEGQPSQELAPYGAGFQARVGAGLQANQRVGQGLVAIPWHWGEQGLSTGSRANDLTIDASDANTAIPEYKVCLCRIEKM